MRCPICGGPGSPLGQLGRLLWWRCRYCGIQYMEAKVYTYRVKVMAQYTHVEIWEVDAATPQEAFIAAEDGRGRLMESLIGDFADARAVDVECTGMGEE